LPNGFATGIGDKGIKLSDGQKQRIVLARVLLKKPPILMLDEPAAMFDPEGERRFIEQNGEKLQGKTVIIIAHRPSPIAHRPSPGQPGLGQPGVAPGRWPFA